MARGWESKSIEEQQADAADRRPPTGPQRSVGDTERAQAIDGLRLARARTLSDLQRACRPAHRGMLEQALADIENRMRELDAQPQDVPR